MYSSPTHEGTPLTPSQNMVYADREGHIGYQAPGRVPIRRAGNDGTMPVEGWISANDWTGDDIPFDVAEDEGPDSLFYRYVPLTARYVADRAIQARHDTVFPWGTFGVNVLDLPGRLPLPAKLTLEVLPPIDLRDFVATVSQQFGLLPSTQARLQGLVERRIGERQLRGKGMGVTRSQPHEFAHRAVDLAPEKSRVAAQVLGATPARVAVSA